MTTEEDRAHFNEVCPSCGKKIAQNERAGSLTSYLFQPFYCSCLGDGERLIPRSAGEQKTSKSRISFGKDSLGSFCPACGLQSTSQGTLGSITGFLFQDIRCKCRPEDQLSGDDMVERFFKLKELEADKVFASVTVDVAKNDPNQSRAINLLPGAIIGGVYRIVRLIGKGGMGEVYLANHIGLGKVCALKLIPPHQVTESSWKRFQNEAKTIAGMEHVNLVKVTDLGIHEACLPYYAMEYLDGDSLADWLKARGRLPLETVLEVFKQVCDGVDYAHRKGVVHRDLKPGNIMMLRTRTGGYSIRILDFGLVKLTQKDRHQQSLTKVGEVFGTPFYMSPEQCIGGRIDNRSDVYSIGCTMFEALTGQVPFSEPSPIETITAHQVADPPTLESIVGPGVFPDSMEVVLAKLLRKNPVERYQTLAELKHDLEKVERGETVAPYYVNRTKTGLGDTQVIESVPPVVYGSRSNRKRLAIVCSSIVLVAAAGVATIHLLVTRPGASTPTPTVKVNLSTLDPNLGEKPGEQKDDPPPASLKETKPYSTLIESEGQKLRCFHFPDDVTIGKLYAGGSNNREARGVISFPAEDKLTLMPELAAIKWPAYLKRFQLGDVQSLQMSKFASEYAVNGSLACLDAMTAVPGVESLDLRNADDLPDSSVAQIGKFEKLKVLLLGKVDLNPLALSKLPIMPNLKQLFLSGPYDACPVVLRLRQSASMQKLSLPATTIDLAAAEAISTMPNLEQLYIEKFQANDPASTAQALTLLSKNTHLHELSIKKLILRPETIAVLQKFRALEILRCDQIEADYSGALRRQLAKELPRVQFGAAVSASGKLPRN
ncbi:MAG: serine/threonine protein kinase [Cyanobacteria bacterium SZAS LIN-3]|nr:serine/threonine protein kinase [Cyanobacteria bacterium SZAS LIN-3]